MKRLQQSVPASKRTELAEFAGWFHQDTGFLFSEPIAAGKAYFSGLSAERREKLRIELAAFLEQHAESSNRSIGNAWTRLGVQWWPRHSPIGETLRELLGFL
jgi:hypothetical protein